MTPLHELAPAKINLCLFLGPVREDGRHELVTLFDSVTLYDELLVCEADADQVVCDGVAGPNLVDDALGALRAAGWSGPPVSVRIDKRIPVAAGLGGGSADAAAMLRVAARLAPLPGSVLARVAAGLGADVPAQLRPGPSIGTSAGDVVEPLAALPPYGVLVLPQPFPLSTAAVYREADRLGLGRSAARLVELRSRLGSWPSAELVVDDLQAAGAWPPAELVVNDLQAAALSLAPSLDDVLAAVRGAGADHALVCGSGPTVIGLYRGADGCERAAAGAEALRAEFPAALAAAPVAAARGAAARKGDDGPAANE